MWATGSPTKTSASPMFGVVTLKRITLRVPGMMLPSSTLQKLAGRSSTRTSQLLAVAFSSTMRSGNPTRSGPLDAYADACSARIAVGLSAGAAQAASSRKAPAREIGTVRIDPQGLEGNSSPASEGEQL